MVVRAMPNTPSKVRPLLGVSPYIQQSYPYPRCFSDQIREGMTILTPTPSETSHPLPNIPSPSKLLNFIFSSIGLCRTLEEKHFDACTALSGSGPAFACVVLEAMADGGVMMGLPRKEALELAAQTMQGSARMVLNTGLHPAQLKDSVTSRFYLFSCGGVQSSLTSIISRFVLFSLDGLAPGGCTIAGLLMLEDGRVRSTIARAIQVASQQFAPFPPFFYS